MFQRNSLALGRLVFVIVTAFTWLVDSQYAQNPQIQGPQVQILPRQQFIPARPNNGNGGYVRSIVAPRTPTYYLVVRKPQASQCNYGCQQPQMPLQYGFMNVLQSMPYCSIFTDLLQSTQMTTLYDQVAQQYGGAVTIFVPSNMGFGTLPFSAEQFIGNFRNQPDLLQNTLTYFAIPGRVSASSLRPGTFVDTCQGGKMYIPQNNCVNGGQIITADKEFSMGYIQVVNSVNYPPATGNLWQTISSCPSFTTFSNWCQNVGISDWFLEGPYTVFLPSNEAFNSLSWAANQTLISNTQLMKQALLGHVVPGVYYSSNVNNGQILSTLSGTNVPCNVEILTNNAYISEVDASATRLLGFGGSNIIAADIPCNNGVIHVIDTFQYSLPTCMMNGIY